MDICITPDGPPLRGDVQAPPSKSAAHRAILCAALAQGTSALTLNASGTPSFQAPGAPRPDACSQDIRATLGAVEALGARVEDARGALRVTGPLRAGGSAVVDCNESGSTERFLVPIAAALGREATFIGRGLLPERPLGPLADVMEAHGARFSRKSGMPFTIQGKLTPGVYEIPGNISSQYVTGLLYALPLLDGESSIVLTTPLESAGYVELTLCALRRSGVDVARTASGFRVRGGQRPAPADAVIEGDWSNGAFWLCARFLGADVRCTGLSPRSAQGDRAAASILERFEARPEGEIEIDASPIPDLVPALCAAAAGRRGVTRFVRAARLRLKECDRLEGMSACMNALGARARCDEDTLAVAGTGSLSGGEVDGRGDHRVVMAAAAAAVICTGPVIIRGAGAVNKSYPDFFTQYQRLGGNVHVV